MIAERLQALRNYMASKNLDAFIIPSTDPHQSEYVADHWKLRAYFSGFTGSAGILVVTQNVAALWTDSRYFLQFEDECKDSEVTLFKQSIPHAPEHVAWLCDSFEKNKSVYGAGTFVMGLHANDRNVASKTASASGLYLVKVNYPEKYGFPFRTNEMI